MKFLGCLYILFNACSVQLVLLPKYQTPLCTYHLWKKNPNKQTEKKKNPRDTGTAGLPETMVNTGSRVSFSGAAALGSDVFW